MAETETPQQQVAVDLMSPPPPEPSPENTNASEPTQRMEEEEDDDLVLPHGSKDNQQQQQQQTQQQQNHNSDGSSEEDDSSDDDSDEDDDDDVVRNNVVSSFASSHHHYSQQGYTSADYVLGSNDMQQQHEEDMDDLQEPEEQDAFTSIWDMVGTYTQSPLETMLSKDNSSNVTLAQVLDEETVIQELKAANPKVVDFLAREDNVKQLLTYLTTEHYKEDSTEAAPDVDNVDNERTKLIFKFPYVACEIVACDMDEINERIVNQEENIVQLFSYLTTNKDENKTSWNSSLSQYFIRTVSTLLQKHYVPITTVLMSKHNVSDLNVVQRVFVEHLNLCDMDTFVLKLLGFEMLDDMMGAGGEGEFGGGFSAQRVRELFLMKQRGADKQVEDQKRKIQQWVLDNQFISLMLDRLEQKPQDDDASRNIFNILTEVVEKANSNNNLLVSHVLTKQVLDRILGTMLKHKHEALFVHGLCFLRMVIETCEMYNKNTTNASPVTDLPEAIQAIHSRTPDFVKLLDDDESGPSMETSFGKLSPPLGEERLKTVEHLALLFKSNFAALHHDLIQQQALGRLLDLMFRYAYHSMLHVAVFSILKHILETSGLNIGGMAELKQHLLVDCQLLERLLKANADNEQVVKESHGARRLGYMGHVIELSNMIRKCAPHQDVIALRASQVPGWKEFVEGPLAEMNLVQERQLGGPTPIGNAFYGGGNGNLGNNGMFQFDNDDDDDDDDFVDDDSDNDSDDSDDEVIVKKE